jgi:hypothetical protein
MELPVQIKKEGILKYDGEATGNGTLLVLNMQIAPMVRSY